MNKKNWVLFGLLVLFFCYLFVFQLIAIWPFTIDDMYVSLRYARNLAEGKGLVWNVGEGPVEGYSNFSFVMLATLAIRFSLDPVVVLKVAGSVGLFFTTIAMYCLSRLWFSFWLAFVPCLWMLVYRGEILWSVSGLETMVYQALICFSLFFLLRGMGYSFYPGERKKPKWLFFALAGFFLALSGLTRPEAPVLMLLFCGLALFDRPKVEKARYYKGLLLGCSICLLFFLPYFLWRWSYYGRLFPNPVYCKSFVGFFAIIDLRYLVLIWPFILLILPAIYWAKDRRHYFFWLPSLVYLGLLVDADPVSAFENRLFLPVFVLLLPLAFLGLSQLCGYLIAKKDEFYYFTLLVVAFLVAFFFLSPLSLANYRFFTVNTQLGIQVRDQILGWLNNHISPNSQIVLADTGQIPYLSNFPFIDSYCLNNKAMTTPPKQDMYIRLCNDVFITKPEVLILTSIIEKKGITYSPADACLNDKLKTNKIYHLSTVFHANFHQYIYQYEIYTLLN